MQLPIPTRTDQCSPQHRTCLIVRFLMSIFCYFILCTPNAQAGMMPQNFAQNQYADQRELERQLEEAFSKMSPEELEEVLLSGMSEKEKKDYYVAKQNLEKMDISEVERFVSGQMNEGEMEQFIKRATEGIETSAATPQEDAPVVEEKKAEEPQKLSQEQEDILTLLTDIIKRSDSLLVKAQSIPDIAIKTQKWLRQDTLTEWPVHMTWPLFKGDVETLLHKFRKLQDKDPITKKYRYINDLASDTALKNNLEQLRLTLNTQEKLIEPPAFGLDKMSKQSRTALVKILNRYAEAIHNMKIGESIDAIFEKYEPTAKKEREKEEALRKKAEEQSGRPRRPGTTAVAGSLDTDYGYSPDYTPSSYGYSGYSPSTYTPSYTMPYTSPSTSEPTGTGGRGGSPKAPGTGTRPEDALTQKAPSDTATPGTPGALSQGITRQAPGQPQERTSQARLLDKIAQQLADANDKIDGSELLSLRAHLRDAKPANPELQDRIRDTYNLLGSPNGVLGNLKTLKEKINLARPPLAAAKIAEYKKQLEQELSRYAETFNKLSDQISSIRTIWEQEISGRPFKDQVSSEKKRLYLGELTLPPAPQPRTQVPETQAPVEQPEQPTAPQEPMQTPVSVYQIGDALEAIKKSIREFPN